MARYRELTRGAIVGDSYGMLKLLVSTEDRTLLGVHVFGTNATDLVHIGQAIMGCGGTVDYLADTVSTTRRFREPTKWPRWTSQTRFARWTRSRAGRGEEGCGTRSSTRRVSRSCSHVGS